MHATFVVHASSNDGGLTYGNVLDDEMTIRMTAAQTRVSEASLRHVILSREDCWFDAETALAWGFVGSIT